MKIILKITITVLIILALLFIAAYMFFAARGKALLTEKLEDALKKEVSIGEVKLRIPLTLEVKELEIKELAKADYVYVAPSLTGLLAAKIVLNEVRIVKPEATWVREAAKSKPASSDSPQMDTRKALSRTKEVLNSPKPVSGASLPLVIKHLRIEDGTINFIDRTVSEQGLAITLKEIQLTMNNLYLFPGPAVTNFQLEAKLPWKEGAAEGALSASGWMDLYQKDIQATLEAKGIDGVYLYPYYYKWLDLENSRIKEAKLDFTSNIKGENNDVTAECRLELTDIKFRPRPPDQPEHKAEKITTAVLGIFRALNQGRIILDFTIKTTMDSPQFKFENISSAVDSKLSQAVKTNKVKIEDLAVLPGKFIEGVTKGTTGATKALIEGAVTIGKSLTDALLDALRFPSEKKEEGGEAAPEQKSPQGN
ncbi:MAG: DUF748 domain-containing protein [Candidatus Omnitrophota bacterium]